jgi:hypothetical protein
MGRTPLDVAWLCLYAASWVGNYSPDRRQAIATGVLDHFEKIEKEVTARAELLAEPIEGAESQDPQAAAGPI